MNRSQTVVSGVGANSFAQPTATSATDPCACHWWRHGYSSERDFIYVTTQSLTHDQLRVMSDEVGEGRSLLIFCKAFRSTRLDAFQKLTVKKFPRRR